MIHAISPIDGRYENKTVALRTYFSEYALIRERVFVEVQYLLALSRAGLEQFPLLSAEQEAAIVSIHEEFNDSSADRIKEIEHKTNHDVKAVEYYIKEKMEAAGLGKWLEWVHFALTSQDINNTSMPRLIKSALREVILPQIERTIESLADLARSWRGIPMLAHTHGQPASPTTVGKELMVFVERMKFQLNTIRQIDYFGKFGGATGNLNAHYAAFPEIDWLNFSNRFLEKNLGIRRITFTTQIDHYDHLADLFHAFIRLNTILVDLSRDFWTYISMEYFKQKTIRDEVGSSAMPHKVNPIDFENAEGNLGIANALFAHLAEKLPISRLQRDLTDSTVLRNVGVPFAHSMIAYHSILKGLGKVELNEEKIRAALDHNWAVLAEAIQNILRREGFAKPYEKLKELTRGASEINEEKIRAFIRSLDIHDRVKEEMFALTPFNYIGKHPDY